MLDDRAAAALLTLVLAPTLVSSYTSRSWSSADETGALEAAESAGPAATSAAARADTLPVPTDPHQLRAFLSTGNYKSWPHQAEAHPADDPHGQRARVYFDATLNESVTANTPTHRQGAAAVLEMYDDEGLIWGWAVAVKARPSSNRGRGWYWYQVKSTPESGLTAFGDHMIPDEPDAAGFGLVECVTCHVKGHDYIVTRSLD